MIEERLIASTVRNQFKVFTQLLRRRQLDVLFRIGITEHIEKAEERIYLLRLATLEPAARARSKIGRHLFMFLNSLLAKNNWEHVSTGSTYCRRWM